MGGQMGRSCAFIYEISFRVMFGMEMYLCIWLGTPRRLLVFGFLRLKGRGGGFDGDPATDSPRLKSNLNVKSSDVTVEFYLGSESCIRRDLVQSEILKTRRSTFMLERALYVV